MGELGKIRFQVRPVALLQYLADAAMQTHAAYRCHLVI
jgi:hypothetical protein